MILPSEERGSGSLPNRYSDPALEQRANLLQLAARLHRAGMVRAVDRCQARVGLFTVVKKVEEGRVHLRLILDARQSNALWKTPPWCGLGGPSSLAWLDLSDIWEEGVTRLAISAGDVPDCYHRMLLPGSFAEWFVIDGITPADLAAHLNVDPVAARLSGRFLGYCVVPMGWSWAVYFTQTCMQDLVGRHGSSSLKAELALVEGAHTP